MSEKERLEFAVKRIRDELRELNMNLALGNLDNNSVIKEKKKELVKALMDLELCKMSDLESGSKRR